MIAVEAESLTGEDRLERLERAARKVLALDLGGRWKWRGYVNGQGSPWLSTTGGGWRVVMQFARLGMTGAQPVFPHLHEGERWPLLVPAKEVPVFEVAPCATSPKDPDVYRPDIKGLRTPMAGYLAEVDAETVLAMVEEIRRLRADRFRPVDEAHDIEPAGLGSGWAHALRKP